MALAMSRPWRHPKTGIYWLRKRVPDDLRPLVGKREEKRSLGTRDPAEAKRLHLSALADIETQWANLRSGPQTLSEREAMGLVARIYDQWVARHLDNPSDQSFWHPDLFEQLWKPPQYDPGASISANLLSAAAPERVKARQLETWCLYQADDCLKSHGLVVDEPSRMRVARAVATTMQNANLRLRELAAGSLQPDIALTRSTATLAPQRIQERLSFEALIEGWAAERRPAAKTLYEWRRVLRQLAAFVGHDDARRLTADDFIAWKAALVAEGLRPKTIRDAKITPARAILQWATDNRLLQSNPAERIVIDVRSKPSEAKRSFTDEEAAIVLQAALVADDPVRRWIPWLCAYSGARLSEICQLRREDIVQIEGVWALKIDPEAGPLKTRSAERLVPLHPAIIDSGFLDFVDTIKLGPIFPGLPPNRFGSRGGNGTKSIGRWVRSLGLTDPRLSPAHSWRHRFKTLARRFELAPDLVSALVGHKRHTVADAYGEYPVAALHRELLKIPPISLANLR